MSNGDPQAASRPAIAFPRPGRTRRTHTPWIAGGDLSGVFQSAQPFFGVRTDFDVFLLDDSTHQVLASSEDRNIASGDPTEAFNWTNKGTTSRKVDLVFTRVAGTGTPEIRIIFWDMYRVSSVERQVGSGSDVVGGFETYGHSADPEVISTAATRWSDGSTPEYFSSRGPVRWIFEPVSGVTPAAKLPTAQIFSKPDVAATDGNQTTFFLSQGAPPPYRFYGTSAAAPHVAGVAALLRDLAPSARVKQIRNAIKTAAVPMANGTKSSVGQGRVDALGAAYRLVPTSVSTVIR